MALNYELLWKVLAGEPSLKAVEQRLVKLSDQELKGAAAAFVDARTELVDALTQQGADASEDILDDIAGFLIREGRHPYEQYLAGSRSLPPSETWGDLEEASVAGPFIRVVRARLRTSIFDLWESEA